MAKTDGQLAECVKVLTYTDKKSKEEKEFYKFAFLGDPDREFTVYPTKYFVATEGQRYKPVIVVYTGAYIDKDGKPRSRNSLAVNWEAA